MHTTQPRINETKKVLLLLLLLSRFSRVRLCATPKTAAYQASPSLGFSRREHWSGLPFPSPVHESEKWKWRQLCPTLRDPMDCSPPAPPSMGFSRQECWNGGAIAFSGPITSNPKDLLISHPNTPRGPIWADWGCSSVTLEQKLSTQNFKTPWDISISWLSR